MIAQPTAQMQVCPCCGQPVAATAAGTAGQTVVCQPVAQPMFWGQALGFRGLAGQPFAPGFARPSVSYAGGLPTDSEIEDMIYDSIGMDPMIPYDANIDVKVEAGTVTLSGEVSSKRVKHAASDDAFWVPRVIDVQNQLKVTGRRKRAEPREQEQ